MNHTDLRAARTQWYAAFVAGDTGVLGQLQAADFFVVTSTGVQSRAMQLGGIAAAVQSGRWFPPGSRAQDERLVLRTICDGVVSAHGVGRMATPQGDQPAVLFTELWLHTVEHGWQVQHLHYHDAPRAS
ncbi:nuclear transport factor 2 family protein [Acidovorax sp. Leaf78]|uniref:nuclear transport factor 2 family protein n=1 Tax=unclassified Acidovorax TaxID=2684926 RepID=UPI0006FD2FD6|nr:nuclear transport factor 2 family protein [Acidovorax sp. Leaf78]KQO19671.1 hypothetical protein ASF16_06840 [Acidovorax sp. Leaf78]